MTPSLNTRLLVAASVVLVAFLGLAGLTVDAAFQESAMVAVRERLQAQVFMLLGAANPDPDNLLELPDSLPEVRFSTPGSGLYALVAATNGADESAPAWRSPSVMGIDLPSLPAPPGPGQFRFESVTGPDGSSFFSLGFTVSWEVSPEVYRRYTFWVVENRRGFDEQVGGFQQSLWGWLLASGGVLLLGQGAILGWSLRPLRQIAREVREIETGQRPELSGPYPRELGPLAENLNTLIHHSHAHLERYRNALGDLAHSLKTPLAVLRGAVETPPGELRDTLREQVERMNRTVDYQLQRAAVSGRVALAAPVPVEPVARKVLDSLAKVYADKSLRFQRRVEQAAVFYGDEGDLMEILGNLADNACKWARAQVRVRAYPQAVSRKSLVLEVEDDGPGIPVDRRRHLLKRGERADPSVAGHGIGLAVVRDIVEEAYLGKLDIDSSPLGGALLRIRLRF